MNEGKYLINPGYYILPENRCSNSDSDCYTGVLIYALLIALYIYF